MRSFTNKIKRLLINDEKYLAVISYTGNKIKNNIDKQREGEFSSAASQPTVTEKGRKNHHQPRGPYQISLDTVLHIFTNLLNIRGVPVLFNSKTCRPYSLRCSFWVEQNITAMLLWYKLNPLYTTKGQANPIPFKTTLVSVIRLT